MQNITPKRMSTNSSKNERIQFLRGIAILAVVMIHSNIPDLPLVIIRPFINYAVALFIFLSGYLTRLEINDIQSFYKKRITKVIVPYVIWSVIYTIPRGFDDFFVQLLTGRCCEIYYYILVYIQFVILTPLITILIKSRLRWVGWFITPVGTLIFRYVFNVMGLSGLSANYNYLFVAWFIYYYLGLYLGNGMIKLSGPPNRYITVYAISIAISLAEGLLWYQLGNFDMATTQLRLSSILTSVSFLLICYQLITNLSRKTKNDPLYKSVVFLGNCSFGIYLSHIVIQQILRKILGPFMLFPIDTLFMISVSAICVAVGKKVLGKYSWMMGL